MYPDATMEDQLSNQPLPKSRSYVHKNCAESTVVGDDMFTLICDPTKTVNETFCARCKGFFPLSQFVWEDTNERIDRARQRWLSEAPSIVRVLQWNVWFVILIALGAPLGAAIGRLTDVGDYSHIVIGCGFGALALPCLWAAVIPFIVRYVVGCDWRRMT